jgi:hypothetical protein
VVDERFDPPMSSGLRCERGFGPGVEATVDDVGKVALEGAAGFALGLAFGGLAGEEGAGAWGTRAWTIAIRCKAALSWRLPPRSKRWGMAVLLRLSKCLPSTHIKRANHLLDKQYRNSDSPVAPRSWVRGSLIAESASRFASSGPG